MKQRNVPLTSNIHFLRIYQVSVSIFNFQRFHFTPTIQPFWLISYRFSFDFLKKSFILSLFNECFLVLSKWIRHFLPFLSLIFFFSFLLWLCTFLIFSSICHPVCLLLILFFHLIQPSFSLLCTILFSFTFSLWQFSVWDDGGIYSHLSFIQSWRKKKKKRILQPQIHREKRRDEVGKKGRKEERNVGRK